MSLAATRNSHQFAAVVGTVTAWNFAEWAAAIQARRLRLGTTARANLFWPRVAVFVVLASTIAAVGSGRFYAWAGEGRTVGIGEEPLWFPHDAVKFAGGSNMPDRLVGFHNGHPALYEYYWAPGKKAYTDARLEVMGPVLYKEYLDLGERIDKDLGGWAETLEAMGRPAVMVDNLGQTNAPLSATLLRARHWRCVWFDPIVSVFVHDSYAKVVESHGVDFAARHFHPGATTTTTTTNDRDPAWLAASSLALRYIATQLRMRPGGDAQAQGLFLCGLDDARRLRLIEQGNLEGWKQAGLIEYVRGLLLTDEVIPRFRLPFDPVFDLSPARMTYDLRKALEIAPDDGTVQFYLAQSYRHRGMDEAAVPVLEKFAAQPNKNLSQQAEKARAADQLAQIRSKSRDAPSTQWANLSDLDRVVAELMAGGRAVTLADVMETAYRPEARPWDWADRLAVVRLHLGEPARARAIWIAATGPATPRLARIAATYLVEGNFESARDYFHQAITADPRSFEAHYGLATLELDAGRATEAAEQARLAERTATSDHARAAAHLIVTAASPYAEPTADRPITLPGPR